MNHPTGDRWRREFEVCRFGGVSVCIRALDFVDIGGVRRELIDGQTRPRGRFRIARKRPAGTSIQLSREEIFPADQRNQVHLVVGWRCAGVPRERHTPVVVGAATEA